MINKIRPRYWSLYFGIAAFLFLSAEEAAAQVPVASPYQDPTAAAGMTSGLSEGLTAQQIEMMRVRTEAQSAQGDAVAASMARSVDQSIEDQNRQRTLQSAREIKAIKRSMADRLKWDRANATQVNKVSSQDMSAWNTDGGNVRVERNVPDPFIASLIEEERQAMARGTLEKPKKGFTPLKSTAAALTSPFQMFSGGGEEYAEPASASAAAGSDSGGGFFSNLRVPGIGRRNESAEIPNPATAEPQFVASSSSTAPPQARPAVVTSTAPVTPGVVPRISGAELVDGSSRVNAEVGNRSANAPVADPGTAPVASAPASLPGDEPEKAGFFSRFKSDAPASSSSGGGGGLFGFGKKKEAVSSGPVGIDASLFPEGSFASAPTGGELRGGYTAEDVVEQAREMPAATGSVELPGASAPEKRSGFSIPKPSLSIPGVGGGGGSSGSVPTLTTVNSSGNDYYVVTGTAQFMVYGDDQMQSEVRALPAGTVVRMTKPGDQWASIQLPGGASGIVQNKFLRAASGSEAGGQFAVSN